MVNVYVKRILGDLMSLSDVPPRWRDTVEERLAEITGQSGASEVDEPWGWDNR